MHYINKHEKRNYNADIQTKNIRILLCSEKHITIILKSRIFMDFINNVQVIHSIVRETWKRF